MRPLLVKPVAAVLLLQLHTLFVVLVKFIIGQLHMGPLLVKPVLFAVLLPQLQVMFDELVVVEPLVRLAAEEEFVAF